MWIFAQKTTGWTPEAGEDFAQAARSKVLRSSEQTEPREKQRGNGEPPTEVTMSVGCPSPCYGAVVSPFTNGVMKLGDRKAARTIRANTHLALIKFQELFWALCIF